jgi:hypothetical protein
MVDNTHLAGEHEKQIRNSERGNVARHPSPGGRLN